MAMLKHENVRRAVQYELDTFHARHDPRRGYDNRQVGYEAALLDYLERLICWHRMPGRLERLPLEYEYEIRQLEALEGFSPDESLLQHVFGSLPAEVEDRAWGYLEGVGTLKRVLRRVAEEGAQI